MVNLMRKYQQTLVQIVTILVIIAFAWLYNEDTASQVMLGKPDTRARRRESAK